MKDIKKTRVNNVKKIRPLFTKVLLTCDKEDGEGLLIPGTNLLDGSKAVKKGGDIMQYQTVVAVGDSIRNLKVGDVVCLNLNAFALRKYKTNGIQDQVEECKQETLEWVIPVVKIDDKDYIFTDDINILYVVEEYN